MDEKVPNRTIYISDSDLPIFEKAQQLAGDNLSATIVRALRRFVEMNELKQEEFKTVTVKIGKRAHMRKQFVGRLLAHGRFRESNNRRYKSYDVYQTQKGKIALYVRDHPDWSSWSYGPWEGEDGPEKMDWGDWGDWSRGEYTFEVFDALEQIKGKVPDELYQVADQNLNHGPIEILDI